MKRTILFNDWKLTRILAAILAFTVAWEASGAEQRLPVLQAGGMAYTNVVVTGMTARDVFIRHAAGLATLKVADLDASTRTALGLPAVAPTAGRQTDTNGYRGLIGALNEIGRRSRLEAEARAEREGRPRKPVTTRDRVASALVAVALFIGLSALYFSFCRSCGRLCRRAGSPSSVLVWLPLLKRMALFKATNISRVWFFVGFVIPFVGACAWILCCLRMCDTFQRTRWLLLPMLLPIIGWLPFMYLDRTSRAEDDDPAVKQHDRLRHAA